MPHYLSTESYSFSCMSQCELLLAKCSWSILVTSFVPYLSPLSRSLPETPLLHLKSRLPLSLSFSPVQSQALTVFCPIRDYWGVFFTAHWSMPMTRLQLVLGHSASENTVNKTNPNCKCMLLKLVRGHLVCTDLLY